MLKSNLKVIKNKNCYEPSTFFPFHLKKQMLGNISFAHYKVIFPIFNFYIIWEFKFPEKLLGRKQVI